MSGYFKINMRFYFLLFFIVVALTGCLPNAGKPSQSADALYVNGKIWTGTSSNPWAEGLAVVEDRIVAIGSTESLLSLRGPKTDYHDLDGKFVSPGFQDSHIHIMYQAAARVDLAGAETLTEIQQRIRKFAEANPDLTWIEGFGWGYGAFPEKRPLATHLDAVVKDRPVFVISRDGHMALANSLAMQVAGINNKTADPENGRIVRSSSGDLTGEFQETAAVMIRRHIPAPTSEQRYQAFLTNMNKAAAAGITVFHEAGLNPENMPLFERAQDENRLLQRIDIALRMVTPDERKKVPVEKIADHIAKAMALRNSFDGPYLRVRSIKGMLDGTIDATTAAMFENYVGTETSGLPFWELDVLKKTVAMYDKAGFQIMLHAIGDRAISEALDSFGYAQQTNGARDSRHRIEHAEMPRLSDLERFRDLGVTASTQPMFAYPDTTVLDNFTPLLGHDRAQYADNFAIWDDAGVRQVFGSDNPVMTLSALKGMEVAVTRLTEAGTPSGGWYPEGRIGIEAALRHYTTDSAWGLHDELERGTLEVGKFADFVVLSHDILEIDPTQISETQVLRTVMGGRTTYSHNN